MADLTPTLSLVKPTLGEFIDLDVLNGNMDKIDTFVASTPDTVALLAARVSSIEDGYTLSTPAQNMTLGTGGSVEMYHKVVGKTVTGRVIISYGTAASLPAAGLRVDLPVLASAKYGAVEGSCLGSASFRGPNGVGITFLSGNRTQLGFYVGVTVNATNGPWAGDLGTAGVTWTLQSSGMFCGNFTYEID